MKIITYQNKGFMLLEYLIVTVLFIILLSISTVFSKKYFNTKKEINESLKKSEIIKITDRIAMKIAKSDNLDVKNNKIILDEIIIICEDSNLKVYSNKMKKADILFNCNKMEIAKNTKKIEIVFYISEKDKIRKILCLI